MLVHTFFITQYNYGYWYAISYMHLFAVAKSGMHHPPGFLKVGRLYTYVCVYLLGYQ